MPFSKFLKHRLIASCPCNTILPVYKPNRSISLCKTYKQLNEPQVPDPFTLLIQVPGSAQYFGPQRCIFLYSPALRLSLLFAFKWRDPDTLEAIQYTGQ